MSGVPDVHDLLHWANRSEVAREITRRGYRVSVETLNRWHRDRKEVPAVVEHIVFDLFGHTEKAAPLEEERLADLIVDRLSERMGAPSLDEAALSSVVDRLAARLGLPLSPGGEGAHEEAGGSPGGAGTRQPRPW